MKNKMFFLVVMLSSLVALVQAQTYEIRAVNKGNGVIGVEMRITSGTPPTTDNSVTDIVFGLKWQSSYNVDLVGSITTSYNIEKSGGRILKNEFHFQAFGAKNTPYFFPSNWTLNNWVEIISISNTKNSVGLGVFAICETGFDNSTDPNIGVDLIDYTPVINGGADNIPLPVNLISFNASAIGCNININWQSSRETNAGYYVVERSENGIDFTEIGRVNASTNSTSIKSYSFIDNSSPAGIIFYRLRLVDNDGRFTYSLVKQVTLNCRGKDNVIVYPTLSNGMVNVKLPTGFENARIRIINSIGQEVTSNESKSLFRTINLKKFANGTYLVQVINDNKMTDTIKVVLQQ